MRMPMPQPQPPMNDATAGKTSEVARPDSPKSIRRPEIYFPQSIASLRGKRREKAIENIVRYQNDRTLRNLLPLL